MIDDNRLDYWAHFYKRRGGNFEFQEHALMQGEVYVQAKNFGHLLMYHPFMSFSLSFSLSFQRDNSKAI